MDPRAAPRRLARIARRQVGHRTAVDHMEVGLVEALDHLVAGGDHLAGEALDLRLVELATEIRQVNAHPGILAVPLLVFRNWHMRGPLMAIVLLLASAPAWGAASDWAVNDQSRLRLISPYSTAPRDGEIHLGLHFKLAPGWHVYWKNSGDAGFPPVVVFGKAEGLGEPELLWPAPERFELPGDLVAFGYDDEVVYPIRARLRQPPGDVLKLSADVDYLVCEVDCVPHRYTLTLDQPLAPAGQTEQPDPATQPLVAAWWDRLPASDTALPGVATEGALVAGGAAGP